MMDAEKLFEMLRKVQEPQGYHFNADRERTFELLEALGFLDLAEHFEEFFGVHHSPSASLISFSL